MMQVRLTKAWGPYSKGHVFPEMPPNQAREMIGRNMAEELREDAPGYATRALRAAAGAVIKSKRSRPA